MRVLVSECGASVDLATKESVTPLMAATHSGHSKIARFLARRRANPKRKGPLLNGRPVSACDIAGGIGDTALTVWFSRVCSNPPCERRGKKKCARCLVARYCGVECQTAHWKAEHKADCQQAER